MASESPLPSLSERSTPEDLAQLQEILKRCSPETFDAASKFRRTGDLTQLGTIVRGVIERYVERELRPKLSGSDANLRLVEDLGLDSLSLMEIVVLAEDVLNISVSNDELTQLRTVGDVQRFITSKLSAPA